VEFRSGICTGWQQQHIFQRHVDGLGHIISNLYINRPSQDYVGLFGYAYSRGNNTSTLKNVGLIGNSVKGNNYVGGLAGYSRGIVTNSYSTGDVSGNTYVGGLVGVIAIRSPTPMRQAV